VRIPVVYEERMMPGRWLALVLCIPSSALTLAVGWWEGYLTHKNQFHQSPEVFPLPFWNRWRSRTKREPVDPGSCGKVAVKRKC